MAVVPLAGKTILVTRNPSQAQALAGRLRDLGAAVVFLPGIEIGPPSSWEALDGALRDLARFDWLLFTSAQAVAPFLARARELGIGLPDARRLHVGAVGARTAATLAEHGLPPDVVPAEHVAEALAAALGSRVAGCRVLLPRAEVAREVLLEKLLAQGASEVRIAPVYRARPPDSNPGPARAALERGFIDVATFSSAGVFHGVIGQLGEGAIELLRHVPAICIGPVTAEACRGAGLSDVTVAEPYTMDGLVAAILRRLGVGS